MRTLCTVILLFIVTAVSAQDKNANRELFLKKGNVSAEVALNLFTLQNTLRFNSFSNGIKLRYFLNDKWAVRLGLGYEGENKEDFIMPEPWIGNDSVAAGSRESHINQINITPGIEYHFAPKGRLSPYLGLDLIYSQREVSESLTNANMVQQWVGGPFWGYPLPEYELQHREDYSTISKNGNSIGDRARRTIGARLLTGMDFYISKSVYLGTEFGLDFTMSKTKEFTQTRTHYHSQSEEIVTVTVVTPEGTSTDLKANILKGIRLGFRF